MSRARRYRKVALIEAVQFTWGPKDWPQEFYEALCHTTHAVVSGPHIHTLEGPHLVTEGDWIAKGIKGEFWPIKDDIFRETYAEEPTVSMAVDPHDENPYASTQDAIDVLAPHYSRR